MRFASPVSVIALLLGVTLAVSADAQHRRREDRFRHVGPIEPEAPAATQPPSADVTEAPTGFDNQTNGYLEQGPPFEEIDEDTVVPLGSFNDNRFIFEEVEVAEDGLGPTYNAQSCRECHQNVATGGASQVAEHRTGRLQRETFFESLGGSLIQSRAISPDILERVAYQDDIRTFRISTNTLGAGYVEAIANSTLQAIRAGQPFGLRGSIVLAPVLEAGGKARIGRFGWKSQHASLVSFSADAYLNEMGITSPLLPDENTSSGTFVGYGTEWDAVPEPEDDGVDLIAFADFMRATKAPARGPITPDVEAGERWFREVGCVTCHSAAITTAPPGTVVNGGEFVVPDALGNKRIHPYSDFLLHDVGTGDGIPLLPGAEFAATGSQLRTAPLWGLRTRNRLMHDGLTFTKQEAIGRHRGQATPVTARYNLLARTQKQQLLSFLDSL